jgi:methionyl-tRNA synthetase
MSITIADFGALDLRVGTIVEAAPIAGARRLVRVVVDLGEQRRTVVAGVAMSYKADELVGLQVVVLANLAPAMIHGVESQGMMLGVGCDRPGEIALLTSNRRVPNGAPVL